LRGALVTQGASLLAAVDRKCQGTPFADPYGDCRRLTRPRSQRHGDFATLPRDCRGWCPDYRALFAKALGRAAVSIARDCRWCRSTPSTVCKCSWDTGPLSLRGIAEVSTVHPEDMKGKRSKISPLALPSVGKSGGTTQIRVRFRGPVSEPAMMDQSGCVLRLLTWP